LSLTFPTRLGYSENASDRSYAAASAKEWLERETPRKGIEMQTRTTKHGITRMTKRVIWGIVF
jgi:hypothetical protein